MKTRHAPSGWLWLALLWGPLAAFANEQLEYFIVSWSCGEHDAVLRVLAQVVPLVLLLGCAAAAFGAWTARPRADNATDDSVPDGGPGHIGFMVSVALGLSLLGAAVIVAQWIPVLYFSPCTIL
jgi:hypothetical protein